MIKNIIKIILIGIILYGIWWYIDKESAKEYLPEQIKEETVDLIVDGTEDITNKAIDFAKENSGDIKEFLPEEINALPINLENLPEQLENLTNINMNEQENISKARLKTSEGDIVIEFYNELAPKTVENFTKLAGEGFYDDIKFHRVIEGFMIQAGDPLSKDDEKEEMWGTGGPGYSFDDEIHEENKNDKGTISMANSGPNTNGSQFFINLADNNFLDDKHTVFGKVVEGLDIVEKIGKVEVGINDRPIEAVVINSIGLE